MNYFNVFAALLTHRKFYSLTPAERGAWITIMLLASAQKPPGRFADKETLVGLLAREGFDGSADYVSRLVSVALLDEWGPGIAIHDWDDHQPRYRYPSDYPEQTRSRKQRSRAAFSEGPAASTDVTTGVTSVTTGVTSSETPVASRMHKEQKEQKVRREERDATHRFVDSDSIDLETLLSIHPWALPATLRQRGMQAAENFIADPVLGPAYGDLLRAQGWTRESQ